ncbi:hypothetical protein [Streptomyces sp. NPDC057682]|uniref:hypothetical protein n=1 Tax=unclassified Streptomyces TaxID=2593676 RepID=UPI00364E0F2F
MSLLELIAAADARGLAASAAGCLDRCLPRPEGGSGADPLRPLWSGCADPGLWPDRLAEARTAVDALAEADGDDTLARIRELLDGAPGERTGEELRAWADACSLLALDVHRGYDAVGAGAEDPVAHCRTGTTEGAGPLLAGEAARQTRILEMLAEIGEGAPVGAGLRQVMDVSTEGQRVLRAAAARKARVR